VPPAALRPAIEGTRTLLRRVAARTPGRRLFERAVTELSAALTDTVDEHRYGAAYFGRARPKADSGGVISGYVRYGRSTSNLDIAAYLVWRFLPVGRVLDIGAARGYLVEALRDLGVDASGVEYSETAARTASPGAAGHVLQGDVLEGLPFRDEHFDVVTAFEVLEHLPPTAIPAVLGELRRVCRGYVVATIPSFGPNPHGPDGFLDRKVRDEVLDAYRALGAGFRGPVPEADLYRDAAGAPVEGHLTVASFAWWTERFADAGLERCGALEERMQPQLRRFGMSGTWDLYVLHAASALVPAERLWSDAELTAAERRLRLRSRVAEPAD